MSLQDDWLEYLDKPDAFSCDHFASLITDTEQPVDLEKAFGNLSNGGLLIERIERVRNETAFTGLYHVPASGDRIGRSKLKVLAERYADSVASRLKDIGEQDLNNSVFYSPIEFLRASDFQKKKSSREFKISNAAMYISDDFIDWPEHDPDYYYALKEAVYMMTTKPQVTRYILSAIVDYPVDDEAYFELWAGGGDIEFCEDRTLIILPDDYEEPKVA